MDLPTGKPQHQTETIVRIFYSRTHNLFTMNIAYGAIHFLLKSYITGDIYQSDYEKKRSILVGEKIIIIDFVSCQLLLQN